MTTTNTKGYVISMPATPGATPREVARPQTLREARVIARKLSHDRRDLVGQDVRIERHDGSLVEYAGPAR